MSKQYFDGIQALRFIASFIVVICHSTYYASERLGTDQWIVWSQGARGVDIFFVISGFVMVVASRKLFGQREGYKIFLERRILRIVPLYWATTTLSLLALIFLSSLVLHDRLDWGHVLRSYFFIPSMNSSGEVKPLHGVGWTLTFEMFFYAIFAVALYLRVNVWKFCSLIILPLSALYYLRDGRFPVLLFYANPIMLEFLAGMFVALMIENGRKLPLFSASVVSIVSLLFILLAPENPDWHRAFYSGLPSVLLVYGVASIEKDRRLTIPRWVLFQGKASYSLYLFHPLSAPAAPVLLKLIGVPNFALSVVLSCVIALAIGSLGFVFIEEAVTRRVSKLLDAYRERRVPRTVQIDGASQLAKQEKTKSNE